MHRFLVAIMFSFLTIPAVASACDCGCGTSPCSAAVSCGCQTACPTTTCQTCCKCVPQTTCSITYKTKSRMRLVRTCETRMSRDRCGCCVPRQVSRLKLVRECVRVPVKQYTTTYRKVCTTNCTTSCNTCNTGCNTCNSGSGRGGLLSRFRR